MSFGNKCEPCVCHEQWAQGTTTFREAVLKILCSLNMAASGLHAEVLCDACLSTISLNLTDINNNGIPLHARIIWNGGFPDGITGCQRVSRTIIDWGDGTITESGNNADPIAFVTASTHDYAAEGNYVITLSFIWDAGLIPTDTIRVLVSVTNASTVAISPTLTPLSLGAIWQRGYINGCFIRVYSAADPTVFTDYNLDGTPHVLDGQAYCDCPELLPSQNFGYQAGEEEFIPAAYVVGTLGFAGVTGAYAVLTADARVANQIEIDNKLDKDVWISFDGTNNHRFVAAGSFKSWDIAADDLQNANANVWVKSIGGNATSGNIYASAMVQS